MFEIRSPEPNEEAVLLAASETQFLDFKSRRLKASKLQEHFVAMANSDGGELCIGIEDPSYNGNRVSGFETPEDANDVAHVLLNETSPPVENTEAEFIDFGARGLVLRMYIPKSPRVHYTSSDTCFVRTNASTRRISQERILQLSYSKGASSYEAQSADQVEAQDIIASDYLCRYLRRIQSSSDPDKFLRRNRLLRDRYGTATPTVAAVLMFDPEPQAALPTRCAIKVYRLHTRDSEYKREQLAGDPITIEGPLEKQINSALTWVSTALNNATFYDSGSLSKLRYPIEALKEVVVNAVIHRDYSIQDDIHIKIYDDRIEVQSPGRLPGYMTTKNILEERFSRNPDIVRLLHKLPDAPNKDIGEGLNTAFNMMREAGLVEPEIIERGNAVVVKIKHQPLASLEDIILKYLENHSHVANKDIRKLSGEGSENKVKKAFKKLRDGGLIEPADPKAKPWNYKYRRAQSQGDMIFTAGLDNRGTS